MLRIELLDKLHGRKKFDCRTIRLSRFLQKTARQHIAKGMSRTFVLVNDKNPKEILGFYTLSICEVETDYLPPTFVKKYPDQVPALKLARLAVSKKCQHKGKPCFTISIAFSLGYAQSSHTTRNPSPLPDFWGRPLPLYPALLCVSIEFQPPPLMTLKVEFWDDSGFVKESILY